MPSLSAICSRLITDLDIGLTIDSIDSLAVGSLTQSNYFRNSNWDSNCFFDQGICRPDAATTADLFRYAGVLTNTTGLLTHTGASYSDITATSETLWLLKPGIRPDQDIIPAVQRGLEYCAFQTVEPLSLAADAAMREVSPTASWGTAVSSTPTKTTADATFPGIGIRALVVTNSATNGYQPTVNIPVTPNETILVGTLSRVKSGTGKATQILWDATNSVQFAGTASTHAESTWQYMQQIGTVPATCTQLNVRLQGTSANNVVVWQTLWVIRSSVLRYNLPSYLDERYKVNSISLFPFTMSTSNTNVAGVVMQASSVNPMDLSQDEYSTDFPMPEANPTYVQFHPQGWQDMWARRFGPRYGPGAGLSSGYFPLVMQMRLPYSERGVIALMTDTTTCPLHLIVPAAEVQLLQSSKETQECSTKTLEQCKKEFLAASTVRTTQGPARAKMAWGMPRTPNVWRGVAPYDHTFALPPSDILGRHGGLSVGHLGKHKGSHHSRDDHVYNE